VTVNNATLPTPEETKTMVTWHAERRSDDGYTGIYVGPNKIQAIKALRETSGLGLADAKHVIESGGAQLTKHQRDAIAPFVEFTS
jgi:ribosomal protein L7/L12